MQTEVLASTDSRYVALCATDGTYETFHSLDAVTAWLQDREHWVDDVMIGDIEIYQLGKAFEPKITTTWVEL